MPRTQADRTSETKQAILNATLEVIRDRGFQQASTLIITKKAKVSRGALLHHYPTKASLECAALEHLLDNERLEIQQVAKQVSQGNITLNDFLDDIWRRMSGPFFMTTLDFLAAARCDANLREHIVPIALRFNMGLNEIWQQFFSDTGLGNTKATTYLNLSLCLFRGMGVQTIMREDPAYFIELLETWKRVLPILLKIESNHGTENIGDDQEREIEKNALTADN